MAASTAPRYDLQNTQGPYIQVPVDANTTIYYGTLVATSTATSGVGANGLLTPCADTALFRFYGQAAQTVVNTGTSGGEVSCPVYPSSTLQWLTVNATSPTELWVNQMIYAADDHTGCLAGSSTNKVALGRCLQVTSTATAGFIVINCADRYPIDAVV